MDINKVDAKYVASLIKTIDIQKQEIAQRDQTIARLHENINRMSIVLESYQKAQETKAQFERESG